jgi:hypothetical protein
MFPFRHSSIFRSRWMALLWAGGIVWTAVDFASPDTSGNDSQSIDLSAAPMDQAQLEQAEKILKTIGK